jgi:HAD superfamily hydrolase (TIGR01509 family)
MTTRGFSGIKVVCFDCDGVIVDSEAANRAYYNHILAAFQHPPLSDEQFAFTHMHTAEESLAMLFDDPHLLQAARVFRRRMEPTPFLEMLQLPGDLIPALTRLRKRRKTAVATNRTDTMAKLLEIHGISGHFDFVVTADDVSRPKPAPDMLLRVVHRFGVNPEAVLYIGDSELDRAAARAAGLPFIAYRNGTLAADRHITSFTELVDRLSPDL